MTTDGPRLQPTFSEAAVMSIFASVVRGALAAAEEIDGKAPSSPATSESLRLALSRSIQKDLDQWGSRVLESAPARLKNEYHILHWLFLQTLEHQMSFGPSHDRPQ